MKSFSFALIVCVLLLLACKKRDEANTNRKFATSFESINDFAGFYIVPQNYMNTSSHQQTNEIVHSGNFSHKAWVFGVNPQSTPGNNNNHRGYPTIQFQKTSAGVFKSPCYITFWVWVDMNLQPRSPENQWLSFATFTTDTSDRWDRSILVNLSHEGYVHLMHVPLQGQKDWLYQTKTVKFPQKQWVKMKIYLDTRPSIGYAKVWQNDTLISYAKISDGNGILAQAHFGLYAAPSVAAGTIYNDDLEIIEVVKE